jgi:hypothetical protein
MVASQKHCVIAFYFAQFLKSKLF